jgi:ferritin-like metal-binding protein YciE
MATLKDLFLDELADMFDAENRISKALPKLAKAATDTDLKEGLRKHHQETLGHIEKLTRVFAAFGKKAKGKECKATVGLLKEGDEIVADNKGEPTLDAGIISACQKVEHYEIASYGCLIEWAKLLGNNQAVKLLDQILVEEKAANETLNDGAEAANQTALAGEDDESVQNPPTKPPVGKSKFGK